MLADPWLLLLMAVDRLYLKAPPPCVIGTQSRRTSRSFRQERPACAGLLRCPGTAERTGMRQPSPAISFSCAAFVLQPVALKRTGGPGGAPCLRPQPTTLSSSPRCYACAWEFPP